jgi:hypothetical protein
MYTPFMNADGSTDGVKPKFSIGDHIQVAEEFFWAIGTTGIISALPSEVTEISGARCGGLTQVEESALGTNIVYWVWFDEPQYDADGDGPYRGGQIWETALSLLRTNSN